MKFGGMTQAAFAFNSGRARACIQAASLLDIKHNFCLIYSYCQNARPLELFAQVGRKQCHLDEVWRHDAGRLLVRQWPCTMLHPSCIPCWISSRIFALFSDLTPYLRGEPALPHFAVPLDVRTVDKAS
jgi:hypothetical protein